MQAKNLKDVLLLGNELQHVLDILKMVEGTNYNSSTLDIQAGPYKISTPDYVSDPEGLTKEKLRFKLRSMLVVALKSYVQHLQDQLKKLGVEYEKV